MLDPVTLIHFTLVAGFAVALLAMGTRTKP